MAENSGSIKNETNNLTINTSVSIDVSDALKGLKAVQREAKKTVRALREVEGMSPEQAILRFSDDDILQELSKRGWEIEEDKFTSVDGKRHYHTNVKMKKIYNEKIGGI